MRSPRTVSGSSSDESDGMGEMSSSREASTSWWWRARVREDFGERGMKLTRLFVLPAPGTERRLGSGLFIPYVQGLWVVAECPCWWQQSSVVHPVVDGRHSQGGKAHTLVEPDWLWTRWDAW